MGKSLVSFFTHNAISWSMKLRVQDQEEDQRGPGERLYERNVKHIK